MLFILVILIFIRPFISSLAFPYLNLLHSSALFGLLLVWIIFKRHTLQQIKFIKYPLLLFVTALIFSIVFSFNRIVSLKESYKYIIAILVFLISASLTYEDKIKIIRAI